MKIYIKINKLTDFSCAIGCWLSHRAPIPIGLIGISWRKTRNTSSIFRVISCWKMPCRRRLSTTDTDTYRGGRCCYFYRSADTRLDHQYFRQATRRTLYYCYSIGYVPDWGGQGLHFSEHINEGLTEGQREILTLKWLNEMKQITRTILIAKRKASPYFGRYPG